MSDPFVVNKLNSIQLNPSYSTDYPDIEDSDFSNKIMEYQDFNIPFQQKHMTNAKDVASLSDTLCNSTIELSTYQTVVRNFLSNDTPYNGLLLYHGLGSGKTCAAITVAEEHRKFLKRSGLSKKIYVLGNKNIKQNFKSQLFHESHLKKYDGEWTCSNCIGNSILREVNSSGTACTKDFLIKKIDTLLRKYYKYMGYLEFASMVNSHKKHTKELFENCMIIIDEVHNIKDDKEGVNASSTLDYITEQTTCKILMLSATPMFNQPQEIIWIMNLLRRNDKRSIQDEKQFFKDGELIHEQEFKDYIRGYVSFVKGENPYTFPYRIYPSYFDTRGIALPTVGIRGESFEAIRSKVYPVLLQKHQYDQYSLLLKDETIGETMNDLSMGNLVALSGILNMSYPSKGLSYMQKVNGQYKYYDRTERCFDLANLEKYSAKLFSICNHVTGEGKVLIYTNLVTEGLIPTALALESMGFHRHASRKNFMVKPSFLRGHYCVLTGDSAMSDEDSTLKLFNSEENRDGQLIKIVIITKAASEGVDFKHIRQIHIMDPWWHLNRIEQVIGRGIRLCSHKSLPFEKRNAQIYLYVASFGNVETIDHYLYRYAETKAVKIGKVLRILKENSMDCAINHAQLKTVESFGYTIPQTLSDQTQIQYSIGDTSFTIACDFMDCQYTCSSPAQPPMYQETLYDPYKTIDRVKALFKKSYVYSIQQLYIELNHTAQISYPHLYETLTIMTTTKTICMDMLSRPGYLIDRMIKDTAYYIYQPFGVGEDLTMYERRIPMNVAPHSVIFTPTMAEQEYSIDSILEKLNHDYHEATQFSKKPVKDAVEWVHIVPSIIPILKTDALEKNQIDVNDGIIHQIIVDHLVEMLIYPEIMLLLNYLFFNDTLTEAETYAKQYFKTYTYRGSILLRVWDDMEVHTLKMQKDNWVRYDIPYEFPDETYTFGTVVGGISNHSAELRVMKTRLMSELNTLGQICDDANLATVVKPRLNAILGGSYKYLKRDESCCLIELLLRYLQHIHYKKSIWFLNSVDVIDFNKSGILKLLNARKRK
jgi:superfamily II DNA or RNA helicase